MRGASERAAWRNMDAESGQHTGPAPVGNKSCARDLLCHMPRDLPCYATFDLPCGLCCSLLPVMSLKAYLAEKYMSGPKADAILSKVNPPKKKKRKATAASTSASSSSFIKDDDLTGWADAPQDGDDDDMAEAVVAEDRRFKKRQRTDADSGWQTVKEGEGGSKTPPPAEDEQPQVVKTEDDEPFTGGLLTSAQLKKKLPRAKQEKKSAEEEAAERAAAQETVYRDSSGRKVDMAAAKAEAARLKREREEKEAKKMEWGKGLVQREEAEKRRKEEETMRSRAFARTVDDKDLNEELKAQDRWNDPAAAFLTVRDWILRVYIRRCLLYLMLCNRRNERKGRENLSIQVRHHRPIALGLSLATDGMGSVSTSLVERWG